MIKSTIYRSWLPLALAGMAIAGLLFSRAVLSIGTVAGFALMLYQLRSSEYSKKQMRRFIIFILFFVIFFTYVFLVDKSPLVIQRMAFYLGAAGILCLSYSIAEVYSLSVPLFIVAGLISCIPTVADMISREGLAAAYEQGQVAATLMEGDHQRFAIWISGCLALAWITLFKTRKKWIVLCIVLLSLFLAVFAVRTGWLFLLIITMVAGATFISKKFSFQTRAVFIITFVILLVIATTVPFATRKINYVKWEWFQQNEADKFAGSDAARRIVNGQALALVKQHPQGMGLFNGPEELKQKVKDKYPQSTASYGWPFNQYLYWWLIAGWVIGSLPLLILLFVAGRLIFSKMVFTASWFLFILLTCLYESTLEMQYGLFLAVFFTGFIYRIETRFRPDTVD
ncbi:MAG: O-antigen ligase family protein [Chitinophagaceae bacterium]|nr:O-antigen ligase family protein [Chitinophagaceae bacterium]